MQRFDGRTVLITGAGSGIGLAMTEQFLAEGALVFAADLDPSAVPPAARPLAVDVTEEGSVAAAVEHVVAETGRLDVVCNNAGRSSITDVIECSLDDWEQTFAVNARGVFLGMKHALPHMLAQGRGAIVNTASVAGMVGLKDRAAYCASKAAVIGLTKQVAVQYAGTGVRANCVCPGTVDSPWVGRLLEQASDPERARADLVARQPMGRLGQPAEIAAAALYLASDDAAFVTGSAFVIDGGLLAG
jgi:NAD(P)-dependent dehydrogenase (short-subunit alcohol dehydrogenase family)